MDIQMVAWMIFLLVVFVIILMLIFGVGDFFTGILPDLKWLVG